MSGHYVALSRRRASLCIGLSSLGDMCWSLDGLQLVHGMEFIFKGGVKIWHLWWDESIWYFLHWKRWIWFSPWWWARPWWLTLYLHVSCSAGFIGDDEIQQRYTFRLLWVLWLHWEHSEDLNLYSDMENQYIFHIFCFSFRRWSARRNREKIVEFILWLRKKELCLTLIGEV